MKWLLVSACTLTLLGSGVQASGLSELIASPELRAKMQAVYGARAIQRSEAFSRLLTPRAGTTDQQKLELVNNYFNNLTYSEDPRLWGMMIIGPIRWSSSGREEGIARTTASPSTTP